MKALIIIPTYNENENIVEITQAILELPYDFEILVVDDNSPDGTGNIAENLSDEDKRIHVLHREEKKGLGPAYIAGFRWGLKHNYDLFFEMDADFSHRPCYLHDFMGAIKEADLVLGSRYITGVNVINWPLGRLLISYFANRYSMAVTGLPIRDATGGFKCYRRDVLESIDLDKVRSTGYAFQIEMSMRAAAKGFKIVEIPIVFYDRTKGTSKMSFGIAREAAWIVWKLRFLKLIGKL
ncbi:MAG: polyprenol monophosphomannose synthase [Candidatus Latescibacteria bacterium]|nr:polyprenol monophosphomannose synthase [Candidatus Latescibacterota bacterium]